MPRVCLNKVTQIIPNYHNIQQAQKCQRKPGSTSNFMTAEIQGRLADVTTLKKIIPIFQLHFGQNFFISDVFMTHNIIERSNF